MTRGAHGCLIVDDAGIEHIPAERVKAVDSTGAGDAFVGSLAYFLGVGLDLREAARRAGAIATRTVLKPGTQTSFPAAAEVAHLLA
jgi:ribokinase